MESKPDLQMILILDGPCAKLNPDSLKGMDSMNNQCSGVILAGGRNSRFSGKNKAFIEICGKTILSRILETFEGIFNEVFLVTKDPISYLDQDILIVSDPFPTQSSLTGVHSALFYASTPYAFITACDTPFLKKEMLKAILSEIEEGYEAIIPRTHLGSEPLNAVYSKDSLPVVEESIRLEKHKTLRVFQKRRVKFIAEKQLLQVDPNLISFFNINTPEDLIKAQQIAENI
jgi:molybdopterin-guanine dinucleotide biosynthesis protein A